MDIEKEIGKTKHGKAGGSTELVGEVIFAADQVVCGGGTDTEGLGAEYLFIYIQGERLPSWVFSTLSYEVVGTSDEGNWRGFWRES